MALNLQSLQGLVTCLRDFRLADVEWKETEVTMTRRPSLEDWEGTAVQHIIAQVHRLILDTEFRPKFASRPTGWMRWPHGAQLFVVVSWAGRARAQSSSSSTANMLFCKALL